MRRAPSPTDPPRTERGASCLGLRAAQQPVEGDRWDSRLTRRGWEPGVLLVGRGVIFDKCICGCGGVGVDGKKAGTAVSVRVQVTWRRDGACLCLFLVIVCRVFACPSVLAGQTGWRSRHMDRAFCPRAPFRVHLMLVDLDRTHQLRWAGSGPRVNGPDFQGWQKPGLLLLSCDQLHVAQTWRVRLPTRSECGEQLLSLIISRAGHYQPMPGLEPSRLDGWGGSDLLNRPAVSRRVARLRVPRVTL